MSAHRQHYFEANQPLRRGLDPQDLIQPFRAEAPAAAPGAHRHAPDWILVALALALLAVQVLAHFFPQKSDTVTPVRSPVVQTYELPPVAVEDARIEGFRAGFASAQEQGCSAALSQPIAAR